MPGARRANSFNPRAWRAPCFEPDAGGRIELTTDDIRRCLAAFSMHYIRQYIGAGRQTFVPNTLLQITYSACARNGSHAARECHAFMPALGHSNSPQQMRDATTPPVGGTEEVLRLLVAVGPVFGELLRRCIGTADLQASSRLEDGKMSSGIPQR